MGLGWLKDLPGIHEIRKDGGDVLATRDTLNVLGSALVEDDSTEGETDLVIAPYSGTTRITTAPLAGSVHNFRSNDANGAGTFSLADLVRVPLTADARITGIALKDAVLQRKTLLVVTNFVLTLAYQDAASDVGNRIITPTGTDLQIQMNGFVEVLFDPNTNRVRVLGFSTGFSS
jgi:hypothetical protein